MIDMARKPAEWRAWMTEDEAAELAALEKARDDAASALRPLFDKLKHRCWKRMHRADNNDPRHGQSDD